MTMEYLIELLHSQDCSCVIANGGTVRSFHQRGVRDLYDLLQTDPDFLSGAWVADKVVGKAAAALMAMGHVSRVYSDVISQPALEVLRQANIPIDYQQLVPHIINRTHTGWCPLETATHPLHTLPEMFAAIQSFIQKSQS